jgi:hypothetical protein
MMAFRLFGRMQPRQLRDFLERGKIKNKILIHNVKSCLSELPPSLVYYRIKF